MAGDPARRPGTRAPPMFQSAPAIDGGRSRNSFSIYARVGPVSIRARHRWRAIRPERPRWLFPARFNPRPPSMAGDPGLQAHTKLPTAVSIRARHRWRAIPLPQDLLAGLTAFQSAPAIDGGRSGYSGLRLRCHASFQSAPAIDGGRSCTSALQPSLCLRFNPRPPSMAGDPGSW